MAMMNFDGKEVAEEFEAAFGKPITELDERQLWWLVKIMKHARGRCRSNTAFNNYMNRNFKGAKFSEVLVETEKGGYNSLKITCKSREGV